MLRQLIKFLLSGGVTVAVEYGAFLLFYYVLTWPLVPAHMVSFCMGMVTSFTLNRSWTFHDSSQGQHGYHRKLSRQFWLYIGLGITNLGLSTGIVKLLVVLDMPPTIAKFSTMAAIAAWSFVIYKKIIFRNAHTA